MIKLYAHRYTRHHDGLPGDTFKEIELEFENQADLYTGINSMLTSPLHVFIIQRVTQSQEVDIYTSK